MRPHTLLVLQCLAALGGHPDDCAVWPNPSGGAKQPSGNWVRYGIGVGKNRKESGGADIVGVTRGGRFFSIECKTGRARLTKAQRRWGAIVTRLGGVYAVARCEADAVAAMRRALDGGE